MDHERPIAVFDIDGVVADVRHRLKYVESKPKNWFAFFAAAKKDAAHPEGVEMVQRMAQDHEIIYVTGRPKHLREDTEAWLEHNGIGGHQLIMRPGGDRRPAAVVKVQLLRQLAERRVIDLVVDDDSKVIAAVAEAGFPTLHATWETRDAQEQSALETAQQTEGRS
jgi:uncharacterized HAD superfamily protein